ncbi:type II toxin-antitoxin system RelE/ParE family toxin [Mesorhizobium sp. PAMC28654]|uniref:type II toxin-antitoxin system RelE/ParE family toxin n=1 Tax=Mesorhizobium sp. PAMC28654 TaxID=2880934 RepID=UPI001D09C952|nr:type II toxin-antitoxin system RelE/ParE family toxin [Mesorhizobium sp. PAMC28654]UDL89690.1 type II toxin-antitoxin system RelE/ParE family toxin [Mesorhizobium sp. PAMC28654]
MSGEAAADRLLDRIGARWQQLVVYPFSGAPREDIAPGIRHLLVSEYLTLYRVHDDAIEIVRVLHGRRQIDADDLTACPTGSVANLVQRCLDCLPEFFHRFAADRQAYEAGWNRIAPL